MYCAQNISIQNDTASNQCHIHNNFLLNYISCYFTTNYSWKYNFINL
jgi:hypothetical protein